MMTIWLCYLLLLLLADAGRLQLVLVQCGCCCLNGIGVAVVVVVVARRVVHPMKSNFVLDFLTLFLRHATKFDCIARHPQGHALLQPTILTPIPVDTVDGAVLLSGTLVVDDGRLAPPEETLATLAGDDAIVDARRFVAAHLARYDLNLS